MLKTPSYSLHRQMWDGQNLLVKANLSAWEGKVRRPVEKSKERSEFKVFHSRVWHGLPDACILIQPEYESNTRLSPESKSNVGL